MYASTVRASASRCGPDDWPDRLGLGAHAAASTTRDDSEPEHCAYVGVDEHIARGGRVRAWFMTGSVGSHTWGLNSRPHSSNAGTSSGPRARGWAKTDELADPSQLFDSISDTFREGDCAETPTRP
jgi:hypothetical protein